MITRDSPTGEHLSSAMLFIHRAGIKLEQLFGERCIESMGTEYTLPLTWKELLTRACDHIVLAGVCAEKESGKVDTQAAQIRGLYEELDKEKRSARDARARADLEEEAAKKALVGAKEEIADLYRVIFDMENEDGRARERSAALFEAKQEIMRLNAALSALTKEKDEFGRMWGMSHEKSRKLSSHLEVVEKALADAKDEITSLKWVILGSGDCVGGDEREKAADFRRAMEGLHERLGEILAKGKP